MPHLRTALSTACIPPSNSAGVTPFVAGRLRPAARLLLLTLLLAQACLAAGNPVLLVGTNANQFSFYYSEILRTEGLNYFDTTDLSALTSTTLSAYDVVILGQAPLTASQVTMFTNWVNGGGNLITMRPDKKLAGLLGIADAAATLSNAYMLVNTSGAPGAGIVAKAIQFHGTADLYSLNGAKAIATLYANATTATPNPAVSLLTGIGAGGSAAAFTYDLANSVVLTRQGNPAWVGQNRDGQAPPARSGEMFIGGASFDPQPDWVDRGNIAIPQADEQQRLLANLILFMNQGKKPLPRFWYLPFGKKAVVIMTGDDHAYGGTAGRFDAFSNASPAGCNVANWECVRGTSYLYPGSPLSDANAATYTSEGFEVALHVSTMCTDYTFASLDSNVNSQLTSWQSQYASIPAPVTNRTHCVPWSDWGSQPQVELKYGIRLDTTYYYWPSAWVANTPGLFTGSGMPMRFALTDGTMIDVYQVPTQMTDESGQSYPATINTLLNNAVGPTGYYGAFTANIHTDYSTGTSQTQALQIVSAAQALGVPVVSSKQMLAWLDGRNGSSFGSLSWNGNTLSFTVTAASGANGLQAMLPVNATAGNLSTVTRNGASVAYTIQTVKGVQYAFFPATAGSYQASYSGGSVTVTPATASLAANQSQQFTATVAGLPSTTVSWSSSNPALGTLSSTGNYIAPTTIPTAQSLTITATSTADATKFGTATVNLITDSTPAVISNVAVTPGGTSATITWMTDKNTNSRVDFGTSSGSLTSNVSNPALVTSHSLTLNGLATGATYYYRVTSADSLSTVTYPAVAFPPSSFATVNPNPPVISALTAVAGPSGTATILWTTDKPATSRVDYGTSAASLSLSLSDTTQVTSHRVTLTGLTLGTTYYYRVTSVDGLGNAGTVPAASAGPAAFVENVLTVWGPSALPAVPDSGDSSSVELGMRFRSDIAGVVAGVRFYKSAGNTGAHIGNLWSNTGTNLATVTFSNETTSGWQQATFSTPVAIAAGTPYVISYYAPVGHYSASGGFFASTGVDNPPLHALADGTSGGNGVYMYGGSSAFPSQTYNSTNYWVDAVFVDNVPPTISAVAATYAGSATITWTTDEPSSSRVDYGLSSSLGLYATDATTVTSHGITLTGLTAGATYYFRVTSTDPSGNSSTSPAAPGPPATFTASGATPPVISAVSATPGSTTATIVWTTDKSSTSRVDYGTSPSSLTLNVSNASLVTSHSIAISSLTAGTVYYYRVTSVDAAGNSATSPPSTGAPGSFTTLTPNPPVISGVTTRAGAGGTASITWTTDKLSSSRVDYGASAASLTLNVSDSTLLTSHAMNLTGLTQGATYYYRVTSGDGSGNSATSPPLTGPPASFVENASGFWSASTTPSMLDSGDGTAVTLGMRFRSDVDGAITGVRFYKAAANTGTHIGTLWSSTGTMLGSVTFANETASGWQQANFSAPIAVAANTLYVVSYYAPQGHYSVNEGYFVNALDAPPLHAPADGTSGANGVYRYAASNSFPSQTYNSGNYWVDVVFTDNMPPVISSATVATSGTAAVLTWTTSEPSTSRVDYGTAANTLGSSASDPSMVTSHSVTLTGLAPRTTYYYRITAVDGGGNTAVAPAAGNPPGTFSTSTGAPPVISSLTATPGLGGTAVIKWTTDISSTSGVVYGTGPTALTLSANAAGLVTSHSVSLSGLSPGQTYYYRVTSADAGGISATYPDTASAPANFVTSSTSSIWSATAVPAIPSDTDQNAVELGVKFRSDVAGRVLGIRFYKGSANTGTHTGHLWTRTGTLLATVTFTNETASGWQQAYFSTPVAVSANTTYIISYYAPVGRYADDANYFKSAGVDNAPLHALANGVDGPNGVYAYAPNGTFPSSTYNASNYWVDVVFAQ